METLETLETPETLIEAPKHVEIGNIIRGKLCHGDVNLGKEKCVTESGWVDLCKVKGFDQVDSSSHGDANIKGISLFVALTGGVMNKPRDIGQHEFKVNVGDLVWAVIRKKQKQSWWPAIVCDGSNALKEVTREDDCLVRCFGNGNYVCCSVCEVKPFVGYFDRLPSQSKAKKFLDALDKAVAELGHRVKAEFTCSCFCTMKMEKYGNFGDLLMTRFEPATFLDYIRDLARVISVPNKIDYAVKQSCLSAFYRSLGHLEIPMDQLKLTSGSQTEIKTEEENGYFDDDFEKSEKPFETRECGISGSMMDVNEGVDLIKAYVQSQPVKKPRKKWTRKNKGVQVNVCSSEVLSQLQFAAQDCLFPCQSKNFDLVEQFMSGFRKRAFNATEIPIEMPNHQILQQTVPKKTKKKKGKTVFSPTLGNDSVTGSLITYFQSLNLEAPVFGSTQPRPAGLGHVPKKRGRKRKTIDLQANPGSTIIPDVTGNHGEPPVGLRPPGLGHVPKKRGRKRKNLDLQANPNLNENDTEKNTEKRLKTKEVGVPCIDLSYNKVQQDNVEEVKGTAFLLKFSPDHPLPTNQDLNSVFSRYGALIESETQVLNVNLSGQVVFLDSSSAGGAFWGLQNDKPFGPVLVNYKIQHLSSAESMVKFKTPIKSQSGSKPNTNSTEIQIVKRSKTIEEIRLPSMDNGEVRGTTLLLKFSPNHPLPSFQDLNSVFCKYGELNEFETQVSGQNLTGQVVFTNPSTAGDAIQRLEKEQPFGQALLSYRVHHLSNVQSAIRVKSVVNVPLELKPCQDLGGLKKNLEMMTLMLEKAGDSLSPEIRGKLESEIKGLMNKVNAMDGSSLSSSCL